MLKLMETLFFKLLCTTPDNYIASNSKISFFDPNFTFGFPKSHRNPDVGEWVGLVNTFWKTLPKKRPKKSASFRESFPKYGWVEWMIPKTENRLFWFTSLPYPTRNWKTTTRRGLLIRPLRRMAIMATCKVGASEVNTTSWDDFKQIWRTQYFHSASIFVKIYLV